VKIKQISVFLENKIGHLRAITEELRKAELNIRAISLADGEDFGVVRMIVEDPDKACDILRASDHAVKETEVIAVEVPDTPGALSDVLSTFEDCNVNIEYMYAVLKKKSDSAVIIFRVEDVDDVVARLRNRPIKLLSSEEVCGVS